MIKKYGLRLLFLLCLGVVGLGGAALGGVVAMRWLDNMTATPAVRVGERAFAMPVGSVPREGGELPYAKEEREAAMARKNPVPASPESVKRGGSSGPSTASRATARARKAMASSPPSSSRPRT